MPVYRHVDGVIEMAFNARWNCAHLLTTAAFPFAAVRARLCP